MTTTEIAADVESEQAILYLLTFHAEAADQLPGHFDASHFFLPINRELFERALACRAEHGRVDLRLMGLDDRLQGVVSELAKGAAPAIGLLGRYVERVVETAKTRRLIHAFSEATTAVARGETPGMVLNELRDESKLIWADDSEVEGFLSSYEEWTEELYTAPARRWVIPNILRSEGRMMIVAAEGFGKSTLCRQLGICAAAGMHPFTGEIVDRKRVLIVDLENDMSTSLNPDTGEVSIGSPAGVYMAVKQGLNRRGIEDWRGQNLAVWSRPDGIDLRSTLDRDRLERVLTAARPDLVIFGPLYKAYVKAAREDDETLGANLQKILDGFRIRHQCAWIFEHHAPHGDNFNRKLRPFGSSLWLRWPDFGVTMEPEIDTNNEPTGVVRLGRFRGDRYDIRLPKKIRRGSSTPWIEAKG